VGGVRLARPGSSKGIITIQEREPERNRADFVRRDQRHTLPQTMYDQRAVDSRDIERCSIKQNRQRGGWRGMG
jgi:hypothetical protein